MNTYRIYGGMSRWEQEDDDGVYGSPSIGEIEADPSVVNWAWWDTAMTSPPNGSDYWWSGEPGTTWPGNARTLFEGLKANGIRPVLTIRTVDNNDNPDWAPNPPSTAVDWNEWWEHVFATVYWLNVRNDYRVDDFEVHNEPNNRGQGWTAPRPPTSSSCATRRMRSTSSTGPTSPDATTTSTPRSQAGTGSRRR
jgi:hypothetical protein